MLSSLNTCLIIVRVSLTHCLRSAQNMMQSLVKSVAKSHQARYVIPNKRVQKISMSNQLHEILYTNSQDMLVYYSLLHCTTISVVQMAAPVPEIMDGCSIYKMCECNLLSITVALEHVSVSP
jgi:hypothetical protein